MSGTVSKQNYRAKAEENTLSVTVQLAYSKVVSDSKYETYPPNVDIPKADRKSGLSED
jgi:hypothetical protein